MYDWLKNSYEMTRKLPDEISEDRANGIFYNVDVLVRGLNGSHRMYENTSPILTFIGPEPIAYWRRAIASYQQSLPFDEVK